MGLTYYRLGGRLPRLAGSRGDLQPGLSYGVCVTFVNEDDQAIVAHDVGDYLLGAGKFDRGHSHMLPEAP
jgi:hypothetical protein